MGSGTEASRDTSAGAAGAGAVAVAARVFLVETVVGT